MMTGWSPGPTPERVAQGEILEPLRPLGPKAIGQDELDGQLSDVAGLESRDLPGDALPRVAVRLGEPDFVHPLRGGFDAAVVEGGWDEGRQDAPVHDDAVGVTEAVQEGVGDDGDAGLDHVDGEEDGIAGGVRGV